MTVRRIRYLLPVVIVVALWILFPHVGMLSLVPCRPLTDG